jgi:hypothetical protein
MLRWFAEEIESITLGFQTLRFCMAASSRTQHKKRAIQTNRFRTKTILASHNLLNRCAAKLYATISQSCPISFKEFGKF